MIPDKQVEEKENNNENKIEEFQKRSSKIIKKEILISFNHEDEKQNSNIVYMEKGNNKKIKYISLDLLLKKIVIDDFMDQNILLINAFCQQCFCFIDTNILFNKIINCYNYYRKMGVPVTSLSNIITFFNILIIEMYQYKEIKEDDPSLILINNFYDIVIKDLIENSPKPEKKNNINNIKVTFKGDNLENSFDDDSGYNNDLKLNLTKNIYKSSKNNIYFNADDSIYEEKIEENSYLNNYFYINENNENNEDNENNININEQIRRNENNISNYEENENLNINNSINHSENDIYKINKEINSDSKSRRTYFNNVNYSKYNEFELDNKLVWSNTDSKKIAEESKELTKEKNSIKEKKHFHLFGFLKKSKDKKPAKSYDAIRNIKDKKSEKNLRKSNKTKKYKAKEEQVLNSIKEIKNNILNQKPLKKLIDITKNSLLFYKIINRKAISNLEDKKKELKKCNSQDNIFKKRKKGDNKEYFCVLDWEEKDIGNKLLLISESLLNKIHNKELYKAIYLKKNKNTTSPNVMENIDKFNRLSFFIILDILSYDNETDRAKMIAKWAKVAEYCKKINNFNDLFAINSALNNYIITGLKLTLKEVPKKTLALLKDLNKFCDLKGNYKKVREYISNLKPDEYYLPYLGILLRDLAFYEENSKYIINGILINFEKIEKVQKSLDKFFKFRYLVKKEIDPVPRRLNFLEHLENIEEEKLEKIASNLEPLFNFSQKNIKRPTYIDEKYFSNIFK